MANTHCKKITPFESGIYYGWVQHRRFRPREHYFRYRVFMMYLNLDAIDQVLSKSRWWSSTRWGLARFKREDYFGNPKQDLKQSVIEKVKKELGIIVDGSVMVLTNCRYFGFIVNPITLYYCFDSSNILKAMVLEVTNTPWREKHSYVLACDPDRSMQRINFDKRLHVSPFHPMDMRYQINANVPLSKLAVNLKNFRKGNIETLEFDARLSLQREDITRESLNKVLWLYPCMTLKVFAAIYWQALKLMLKRMPVYRNNRNSRCNGHL